MGHFKGQPMEIICWEKAERGHHPRQYEYVLLHCVEDQYPYPNVVEGYWTDAAEGYFSLLDDIAEMIEVDYWAKLPGGPGHERH